MSPHTYKINIEWTGNLGSGTSGYRDYERSHTIFVEGKQVIHASSDPDFRGDPTCYNPEEMLVASLSACHMLWFLHLCADAGVVVESYRDQPIGIMNEGNDSEPGRFSEVRLRPEVGLQNIDDSAKLKLLHDAAHKRCFIANSVNFPIVTEPVV